MDRFWIVYLIEQEYRLLGCSSYGQADYQQSQLQQTHGGVPVGIYDQRADSFEWEPVRRYYWRKLTQQEQTQQDGAMIERVQLLLSQRQPVNEYASR